jgi:hypothetical protein
MENPSEGAAAAAAKVTAAAAKITPIKTWAIL